MRTGLGAAERIPPWLTRFAAPVFSGAGIALTAVSVIIELTDAEPRAELWVGAAAGAAFLMAVPFVGGDEAQVLTRRAKLLMGAGVAAVLAVIGLWQATSRSETRVLLLLVPALLLFLTSYIAIREAERIGDTLRTARLRSRLTGQEAERLRWAQELHDQTLQDLAAIEVRLGRAASARDPGAIADGVQESRRMVREEIRILRHLITQMRPLALDTLGLAAALEDLARRAEDDGGLPVRCDLAQLPSGMSATAQVCVYRIVQEAITNSLRHAACHEITLATTVHDGTLTVTIADDGIGLEAGELARQPVGTSFGRAGMAERADAIHGRLTWTSPPGNGTRVTLTVRVAHLIGT